MKWQRLTLRGGRIRKNTHPCSFPQGRSSIDTRKHSACAKKPVRAVAHCKAGVSNDHFVQITDDHYSDMLVTNIPQSTDSEAVPKPSTQAKAKDDSNSLASSSSTSLRRKP